MIFELGLVQSRWATRVQGQVSEKEKTALPFARPLAQAEIGLVIAPKWSEWGKAPSGMLRGGGRHRVGARL
jgi:hypothetical protein